VAPIEQGKGRREKIRILWMQGQSVWRARRDVAPSVERIF